MPELPDDVAALARRLADALETARVPYAIGGALAYGQWALPRGTSDIDLTLFVEETSWPATIALLQAQGVVARTDFALRSLADRGMCRMEFGGLPLDVFVPSIPFYQSVQCRIVQCFLLGRPAWFLTAEDLTVFKLLFFRPKDLVDIRYMLGVRGAAFDRLYVRRWIIEMVGERDERVEKLDELYRQVPSP